MTQFEADVSRLKLACFALRMVFAIFTTTSFAPDEYYQTVEPAYAFIYEDVFYENTWEWQSSSRIRSYVPILPYILLFAVGKALVRSSE